MTLQEQLDAGIALHQANRLHEAEKVYRGILAQQPNYADALHLLGLLAGQTGHGEASVDLIRRAIAIDPIFAVYQSNLGNALVAVGRNEEAAAACREAIRLAPDLAEAHNNLGNALRNMGQLEEAIVSFRRAVQLKPDLVPAINNLGNALHETGKLDESIASFREAIRVQPEYAIAHSDLSNALRDKGQLDEAVASCREAIRLWPNFAGAHNNLGVALGENNRLDESLAALQTAIGLKPDYAQAHNNLGKALQWMERVDEAIPYHRRAIELRPDYADAYNELGNALNGIGLLDEAIVAYRQAVGLKSNDAGLHGNLLFVLNNQPVIDAEAIAVEHRVWADRHAAPLAIERTPHGNDRSPDRRIRVGYVSSDFRRHSVGYFLLPLLEHHNHQDVEVFCYANVQHPDDVTERMKRSSDHWRDILGQTDDMVASQIRADGIDILVDLMGHTAHNRLGVFARKPAPVQATYLGYPNTTGMGTIDYRLTDGLADPVGMTDPYYEEKLWRVAGCAWCYEPPADTPEVSPRGDGPIVFGCFNAFPKINREMVAVWGELLRQTPGSRLLLKSAGAGQGSARARLMARLGELGIAGDRIEMRGRVVDSRDHLRLYGQIDIALDTFPYNGTTTTCEALWMSVPVVSLAGMTHASRVGVSLLSNAGLAELVAQTPQEYVRIASALAGDRPRLAELRRTLRQRVRSSPLMDGAQFARNIESAYRQMWRSWCEKGE